MSYPAAVFTVIVCIFGLILSLSTFDGYQAKAKGAPAAVQSFKSRAVLCLPFFICGLSAILGRKHSPFHMIALGVSIVLVVMSLFVLLATAKPKGPDPEEEAGMGLFYGMCCQWLVCGSALLIGFLASSVSDEELEL